MPSQQQRYRTVAQSPTHVRATNLGQISNCPKIKGNALLDRGRINGCSRCPLSLASSPPTDTRSPTTAYSPSTTRVSKKTQQSVATLQVPAGSRQLLRLLLVSGQSRKSSLPRQARPSCCLCSAAFIACCGRCIGRGSGEKP